MNPSKREDDSISQDIIEREFKKIIKILKKLPQKDIDFLTKLIERQIIFEGKRLSEVYFQGKSDLWDEIFQALKE